MIFKLVNWNGGEGRGAGDLIRDKILKFFFHF